MTINERIKILIDTLEDGVASKFANKIGVARTTISSMIPKGRGDNPSKPSFDILEKIVAAYPSVSAAWLLGGEGEAPKGQERRDNSSNSASNANNSFRVGGSIGGGPAPDSAELQYLKSRVADLEQQLRDQIERNNKLVDTIVQLSSK
jgi:hypothetical protein